MLSDFYKQNESDLIWWVDDIDHIGHFLFSFDQNKIYNMFADYPHNLSKEEKEAVKTQFKDLVKSMPSLAIFMLPGGAVLLPIVLKVIPDLIPSAFRDNEVEKEK